MLGHRGAARWLVCALALGSPWLPPVAGAQPEGRGAPAHPAATRDQQATSPGPGHAAFSAALRLLAANDHDDAKRHFEQALRVADATGDTRLAAGCHRGLGLVAAAQGQQDLAVREQRLARELFVQVGDRRHAGASAQSLGTALYWLGRRDEAREAWQAALDDYATVDDRAQQASVLYNLAFVAADADERRRLLDRGLPLAQEAGSRPLEGQLLAARSDLAFARGDYRAAYDDVVHSIAVLGEAGSGTRKGLAHAYTSLGRLYRAHAQFEAAIAAYERAFEISRDAGDPFAQAQAARALAIAYEYLGRQDERREYLTLSLDLMRRTSLVTEQYFAEVHLADYLVDSGSLSAAFEILDRVAATDWGRGSEWTQNTLARARLAAGDAAGAIEPATRAVELSRRADDVERLFHGLQTRAQVHLALARYEQALADARDALDLVEQFRQRLVPHDYMKRGFMDRFTVVFGLAIETLEALERHAEAIDVTEQARARAIGDLLMARRVQRQPEPLPPAPAAMPASASDGPAARRPATTRRAANTRDTQPPQPRPPALADDLPSHALAPPGTFGDFSRAAAFWQAAVLTYWVGETVTWIWVITPAGEVVSARAEIGKTAMAALVRRVWQTRDAARDAPSRGRRGARPPATRELHRLLIAPVRHMLSTTRVQRLIVVPHGPLSALSFAALQDEHGRYLLEDYTVSYSLAGWMLASAMEAPPPSPVTDYLLAGAPARLPAVEQARVLTSLPGTRRELSRLASQLRGTPTARVTRMVASESRFRDEAARADVLHLATHGVMNDEAPLDSFLAFEAHAGGGPTADDGRLTAREVYDLDLRARLVVLSACRSGLGRSSGDGLLGLARAFFAAGARSLVATLWDVADEPAAHLMPRFHALAGGGTPVADALRTSQLELLRDLRAGRVIVEGRRGPVPLPEHPALWASFVAIGVP